MDKRMKFVSVRMRKFVLHLVFAFALFASLLATGLPAFADSADDSGAKAVRDWNEIAVRTAVLVKGQNPPQSSVYVSYTQAAVYDAVSNIQGEYEPYHLKLDHAGHASVDAAVATAAYQMLVYLFPDQQSLLDMEYTNSMNAIPDSLAKQQGIEVGHLASEGIKTLRLGDGRDANIGYTTPQPGPGRWELVPPAPAPVTPWLSKLKPFLLNAPNQFRPGNPFILTSNEWTKNYNEVKNWGGAVSALRTPEQTEIARFWTEHPTLQYNRALQKVALDHHFNAVKTAWLLALADMAITDSLIACFDAKFEYEFWRPYTAIRMGHTDNNPNTVGDPSWTALVATPGHPEYPSAHGCATSAVAEVLTEVLGSPQIDFTVHSRITNTDRTYSTAKQLIDEVQNARVWGGIHYRISTQAGADLGRQVTRWSLKRFFLPED